MLLAAKVVLGSRAGLVCVFLLGVSLFAAAINYAGAPTFLVEHAADEHAYIGLANRTVFLRNVEPGLLLWRGWGNNILPYSLGSIAFVSGLSTEAVFRITHLLVIFMLVLSGYRLGKILSLRPPSLFLFSAFFSLLPSTGTWIGPAAMVPSTLAFIPVVNIIADTVGKNYRLLIIWLAFLSLIYWWFLIPAALFLSVYFVFYRAKSFGLFVFILTLIAAASVFIQPLIKLWLPFAAKLIVPARTIFEGHRYWGGSNYFQFVVANLGYLLPIVLISFMYVVGRVIRAQKRDLDVNPAMALGVVLLAASALFLFLGGVALFNRSIVFFFIGLFLFVVYFFEFVLEKHAKLSQLLLVLVFSAGVIQVASVNASQFYTRLSMTGAERFWIKQLKQTGGLSGRFFVSDFNTIKLLTYYVDGPDVLSGIDDNRLMNFFASPILSAEDLEFLNGLRKAIGSERLYILISDRTRVAAGVFQTVRSRDFEGVPKDFKNYGPMPVEEKLSSKPFKLVLERKDEKDGSFVAVYEYEP